MRPHYPHLPSGFRVRSSICGRIWLAHRARELRHPQRRSPRPDRGSLGYGLIVALWQKAWSQRLCERT